MRPPLAKNASNSRLGSVQSKRRFGKNNNNNDDARTDGGYGPDGGALSSLQMGLGAQSNNGGPGGRLGYTDNALTTSNRNALREAGKSQAKRTGGGYKMDSEVKKNNLMNTTNNSFKNGNNEISNS